jgi:membrane protease YdiL (CAAX protease family)
MSQLDRVSDKPARRGKPLAAWLVIAVIVGLAFWRSGEATSADKEQFDLMAATLQARILVGIEGLLQRSSAKTVDKKLLFVQAKQSLDRNTYAERLRFVVLAGEFMGPSEAVKQLQLLNDTYRQRCGEPLPDDRETGRLLERLFILRQRDPPALALFPEHDRDELRRRLDWFGELALTPEGESDTESREKVLSAAIRVTVAFALVASGMIVFAFGGLILFITLGVLCFLGRLKGGLTVGSPHGAVYAETFACYMVLFLALSKVGRYVLDRLDIRQGRLALSGAVALFSLLSLLWPVVRGIPWRRVCDDIGWSRGRGLVKDVLAGIGGYSLALSILPFSLIAIAVLTKLRDVLGWGPDEFGPSNAPGHPIVFAVKHSGWWIWLEMLFAACIAAPLVEETMFRGVLYRHLREAFSRWKPALSVLSSAFFVSFVFAVIHPQGFLAVPALMALAFAFALLREWRVSLLPAMVSHALNNAVTTLMLYLMLN